MELCAVVVLICVCNKDIRCYNNGKLINEVVINSYKLESWKAESRYNIEFIAELNEVVEALNETKKFLDINGLTFIREAKITEDVEKSLRDLMPKDIVIADDFELNCYYHVFEKKLQDKELCSNGGN